MRYFIELAYNGASFCGWQVQPNGPTIQAELENAFSLLLRAKIEITGCGRTDAGVHASQYFAHFDFDNALLKSDLEQLTNKLNSFLPDSIVIYRIFQVEPEAHARFDAMERTYQYHVSTQKLPFKTAFSHRVFFKLDIEAMNNACEILFKHTDFSCFSKTHTQTKTNLCTITFAQWQQVDDELIFTVAANRFLRNMVRAIVGTMLEIGQGKISLQEFEKIIESKDRCQAGTSVPAKALFLVKIKYDFC